MRPLGPRGVSLVGFQSKIFGGLISSAQVPNVSVLNVGHKSLISKGVALSCEIPPYCGSIL